MRWNIKSIVRVLLMPLRGSSFFIEDELKIFLSLRHQESPLPVHLDVSGKKFHHSVFLMDRLFFFFFLEEEFAELFVFPNSPSLLPVSKGHHSYLLFFSNFSLFSECASCRLTQSCRSLMYRLFAPPLRISF